MSGREHVDGENTMKMKTENRKKPISPHFVIVVVVDFSFSLCFTIEAASRAPNGYSCGSVKGNIEVLGASRAIGGLIVELFVKIVF